MNKSVASLPTKCRVMIVKREFGKKREMICKKNETPFGIFIKQENFKRCFIWS